MNMPGFNAEASLYKTGELYHTRSMGAISSGQVVPQQMGEDCWYGHWCGPGCGGGTPIDNLDWCCKRHDECYRGRGYLSCYCDWELGTCAASEANFWSLKGLAAAAIASYMLSPVHPCIPPISV